MKASWFYRIAAVLLVLFAVGHTTGFRKTEPQWGVDGLLSSLKQLHFNAQGFDRTYYDFFVGFGLFVSIFMVFAAVVAWQLGSLPGETVASLPMVTWGFAICMAAITVLSWTNFFVVPVVFSGLITVCLVAGAWLAGRAV
jgi:hypothetical protein